MSDVLSLVSSCLLSLVSCPLRLARGASPTVWRAAFVCLASPCLAIEATFVKVPPPVYAGLVKDYMQSPYGSSPSVQVYARRATDGKLLASSQTATAREGVNYSVTLPMLSADSEGIVGLRYGEKATFSFLDGDVLWQNLATVTTDKPGYHRLDVTLGHDENGDGIADEYVAYIQLRMEKLGLEGTYDPDADSNKDGITNREHYLAGTDPFAGLTIGGKVIAEEKCTISSLMNVRSYAGDDYFAITFNAIEEVAYSVVAIEDLAKGWGEATAVATRTSADDIEEEPTHWAAETGEMTLYVPKGKASQMFYKLAIGE